MQGYELARHGGFGGITVDHIRFPLFFDVTEVPPHDRYGPRSGERTHNDEAGGIDVEVGKEVEEGIVKIEFRTDQTNQFDRPDEEGYEDR
jgi:hypothetical protein